MGDKLENGRPLLPGATPPGIATRGEIGLFGETWYDNNGDKVPHAGPGPMAKYAKGDSGSGKKKKG